MTLCRRAIQYLAGFRDPSSLHEFVCFPIGRLKSG